MKSKHTFRLSPEVASQLAEMAIRRRVSQAEVVEAALVSFLSPDGSERMEAALSRRIDRVVRQLELLDRSVEVGNEALALFVRSWLTANPPLPDAASAAAQAKGKDRYDSFVQALSRRLDGKERLAG
ncbi:ribbon-helix-helix CopG family protein [Novosphingobium kunmingense]|uniref:Ribbon-helix-helix CopG family protein n=1 Tax=Novosphingobium kunmingense TaxID=1211806 RepID=A0A2N0H5S9_9SPHN|nr:ribbon-helix-helix protein, CopG family [Novosphingobium kunmingense]PKB14299.1 ribbon-helix-helix CopG family protein [Novosphingobium kunmingense]